MRADYTAKADYGGCSHGEARGTYTEGSFSSKSACESFIKQQGLAYCVKAWCEDRSSGSTSSSGSSLESATTNALAHGLAYGDAQTLGAGIVGLGVMSMSSGGKKNVPSPQQLQQEENARLARAEEARRAEAERQARFNEKRNDLVSGLKGDEAGLRSNRFDFSDLKEDDEDQPKPKYPRLKKMENPLRKEPLPEDSVGILQLFDDWEDAADCTGTTARAQDSRKIVCCPPGYPNICGGKCYKEAALQDHRIPCDDVRVSTKRNSN
jgi:hypothetical protein